MAGASKSFLKALTASRNEDPKWDIRTEQTVGTSITPKTGKVTEGTITRVRFRKYGSKGRFQSFVVVGKMPTDNQKLVDAYVVKTKMELAKHMKKMGRR